MERLKELYYSFSNVLDSIKVTLFNGAITFENASWLTLVFCSHTFQWSNNTQKGGIFLFGTLPISHPVFLVADG